MKNGLINPSIARNAPADARNSTPSSSVLLQDFIAQQKVRYYAPYGFAFLKAREFVVQHTGDLKANPDKLVIATLYINEQDSEQGGEPARATLASCMTLTAALMRNWQQNGNDQFLDHLGHLRDYRAGGYPARITVEPISLADCFAYEAVYRKTEPQRFDSTTHVGIDPRAFKHFVWEADLQSHYESSLKDFWQAHGANYDLLLKAALLRSAYVQYEEGSLTLEDKALVLKSLGLDTRQPWETLTLDAFKHAPMNHAITFRELVLYRYASTDIIVIKHENTGRLLMYIPGNSSPLHGFMDMSELRDWVVQQCKDVRRRRSLETHFRVEDEPDGPFLSGLQTTLAGLAAHPHRLDDATGHWWPAREITLGPLLAPWPFLHFKKSLQDRLVSDGLQLIRSRADNNKEVAALILNNAIVAVGALAMVVPYLWAPLAAMSLALAGLGADEMVNGRTEEEKQLGAGRLVFGLLNAVPAGFEGGAAASRIFGAASRVGDTIVPGAADEVGQMIESRSAEEQASALGKHQQYNARLAEQAHEHAAESASERQLRLHEEEAQRRLTKVHREATYDSGIAFGVEPEGLRSLSPFLRTELTEFEHSAPLEAGGAWKIDDFGAVYTLKDHEANTVRYFARVHSKIYSVERVMRAGQYRIFSLDNPELKGPFIKRAKGYYSDLDLKTGLRGGDSYIEIEPEVAPVPEPEKPDIVLATPHRQVPTHIRMDGIEIRLEMDSYGNRVERYYADNALVNYDCDEGVWRFNVNEVMWLDNKGKWQRGSLKAFQKARRGLKGIKWLRYDFPALPGLPKKSETLDKTIHQIWLGSAPPRSGLIETIKGNIAKAPDYRFVLHIDIDNAEIDGHLDTLRHSFADYPNMTISTLHDEPFFNGFLNDDIGVPFDYFRHGEAMNLAAASDALRYRLIREYGGIYMDCDDRVTDAFNGVHLMAGPSDVLVGTPVWSPDAQYFGPNNSHFASLPGNPVLEKMEQELCERFLSERDVITELSMIKSQASEASQRYVYKIFEVTGPRLFIDTLKKWRPDYAELLDLKLRLSLSIRSAYFDDLYHQLVAFYAPFGGKISVGIENSWKRSISLNSARAA